MKNSMVKKIIAVRFGNAEFSEVVMYEENLREFFGQIPSLTMAEIKSKAEIFLDCRPGVFTKSVKKEADRWKEVKGYLEKSDLRGYSENAKEQLKLIFNKITESMAVVTAILESLSGKSDYANSLSDKLDQLSSEATVRGSLFSRGVKPDLTKDFKQSLIPVLKDLNARIVLYTLDDEKVRKLDEAVRVFDQQSMSILTDSSIKNIQQVRKVLKSVKFEELFSEIRRQYNSLVPAGIEAKGLKFYAEKIALFEGRLALITHMTTVLHELDGGTTIGKRDFSGYPNKKALNELQNTFYTALKSQSVLPEIHLPKQRVEPTGLALTSPRMQPSVLQESHKIDSKPFSDTLTQLGISVKYGVLKELLQLKAPHEQDVEKLPQKISDLLPTDSTKNSELAEAVVQALIDSEKKDAQYRNLMCRFLGELLALEAIAPSPMGISLTELEQKHVAFQYHSVKFGMPFDSANGVEAERSESYEVAGLVSSRPQTESPVFFDTSLGRDFGTPSPLSQSGGNSFSMTGPKLMARRSLVLETKPDDEGAGGGIDLTQLTQSLEKLAENQAKAMPSIRRQPRMEFFYARLTISKPLKSISSQDSFTTIEKFGVPNEPPKIAKGGIHPSTQKQIKKLYEQVVSSLSMFVRKQTVSNDLFNIVNKLTPNFLSPESVQALFEQDPDTNIGGKARVLGLCILGRLQAEGKTFQIENEYLLSAAERKIIELQQQFTADKLPESKPVDTSPVASRRGSDSSAWETPHNSSLNCRFQVPHSSVENLWTNKTVDKELYPTEEIGVYRSESRQLDLTPETAKLILDCHNDFVADSSTDDSAALAARVHRLVDTLDFLLESSKINDLSNNRVTDLCTRLFFIRVVAGFGCKVRHDIQMSPIERAQYQAQMRFSRGVDHFIAEQSNQGKINLLHAMTSAEQQEVALGKLFEKPVDAAAFANSAEGIGFIANFVATTDPAVAARVLSNDAFTHEVRRAIFSANDDDGRVNDGLYIEPGKAKMIYDAAAPQAKFILFSAMAPEQQRAIESDLLHPISIGDQHCVLSVPLHTALWSLEALYQGGLADGGSINLVPVEQLSETIARWAFKLKEDPQAIENLKQLLEPATPAIQRLFAIHMLGALEGFGIELNLSEAFRDAEVVHFTRALEFCQPLVMPQEDLREFSISFNRAGQNTVVSPEIQKLLLDFSFGFVSNLDIDLNSDNRVSGLARQIGGLLDAISRYLQPEFDNPFLPLNEGSVPGKVTRIIGVQVEGYLCGKDLNRNFDRTQFTDAEKMQIGLQRYVASTVLDNPIVLQKHIAWAFGLPEEQDQVSTPPRSRSNSELNPTGSGGTGVDEKKKSDSPQDDPFKTPARRVSSIPRSDNVSPNSLFRQFNGEGDVSNTPQRRPSVSPTGAHLYNFTLELVQGTCSNNHADHESLRKNWPLNFEVNNILNAPFLNDTAAISKSAAIDQSADLTTVLNNRDKIPVAKVFYEGLINLAGDKGSQLLEETRAYLSSASSEALGTIRGSSYLRLWGYFMAEDPSLKMPENENLHPADRVIVAYQLFYSQQAFQSALDKEPQVFFVREGGSIKPHQLRHHCLVRAFEGVEGFPPCHYVCKTGDSSSSSSSNVTDSPAAGGWGLGTPIKVAASATAFATSFATSVISMSSAIKSAVAPLGSFRESLNVLNRQLDDSSSSLPPDYTGSVGSLVVSLSSLLEKSENVPAIAASLTDCHPKLVADIVRRLSVDHSVTCLKAMGENEAYAALSILVQNEETRSVTETLKSQLTEPLQRRLEGLLKSLSQEGNVGDS